MREGEHWPAYSFPSGSLRHFLLLIGQTLASITPTRPLDWRKAHFWSKEGRVTPPVSGASSFPPPPLQRPPTSPHPPLHFPRPVRGSVLSRHIGLGAKPAVYRAALPLADAHARRNRGLRHWVVPLNSPPPNASPSQSPPPLLALPRPPFPARPRCISPVQLGGDCCTTL